MRGPMIETEARRILDEGIAIGAKEEQERIALKMLSTGRLEVKEISDYTGLEIEKIDEIMRVHKIRGITA